MVILWILAWILSPVWPTRDDILGEYEIDRSFYPGDQADWQHATYRLEIGEDQLIVRDTRTTTSWNHAIEWDCGADYLWGFADATKKHHMVSSGPSIVREAFGHYYFFTSPLYGDVVFRKKKTFLQTTTPWVIGSLLVCFIFRRQIFDWINKAHRKPDKPSGH